MLTCDLCGLTLAAWTSKKIGRCYSCRREHGEPYRTPAEKIRDAAEILGGTVIKFEDLSAATPKIPPGRFCDVFMACGECPSCEQGHPERCRALSRS